MINIQQRAMQHRVQHTHGLPWTEGHPLVRSFHQRWHIHAKPQMQDRVSRTPELKLRSARVAPLNVSGGAVTSRPAIVEKVAVAARVQRNCIASCHRSMQGCTESGGKGPPATYPPQLYLQDLTSCAEAAIPHMLPAGQSCTRQDG
jgi:hypothetical protein